MRNPQSFTLLTPQVRLIARQSDISAQSAWNHEALFQVAAIFTLLGVVAYSLKAFAPR